MINVFEVQETNKMIEESNLDVRTITMGISLLDCCDNDVDVVCDKIYRKITEKAENLVKVGEQIELDYGIPIVNKRISVTPIALVGGSCCKTPEDYVKIAKTLDRAAHTVGINFLGGYSALVSKGMTPADKLLIESIPQALAETELVCSSVNVGSTKTGIDMDAVKMLGETVKKTAELTKDNDSLGCAKLVIFCNAPDDNPFMAGAFHGVTEGDVVINVGVSGPGVVKRAIEEVKGQDFGVLCETIKKTAFKVTRVGQLVAQEASRRLNVPFGIIDLSLAPTPAVGDSVAEILQEMGVKVDCMKACGGGGKSPVWRQMLADLYNCSVERVVQDEGPALGAAILAGVACGIYESVEKACDQLITRRDSTEPKAEDVAVYEKYHRLYQKLYTSLKNDYKELAELS